jgi:hypothetical protein
MRSTPNLTGRILVAYGPVILGGDSDASRVGKPKLRERVRIDEN